MKIAKNSGKKHTINSHAWVLGAISFILALIVGEIIVAVFLYFNRINRIAAADWLLVVLYVIPALAVIIMCVAIYLNHRSLETSKRIVDALNRVAGGDYSTKISYKKLDGFNAVYENFNKMTEELKSVKALREDFVRDFSHEFKTPIASINGFANLLLEGDLSEEERREIVKIIADESARLSGLSETVLTLSKLESQQFVGESKLFRLDVQLRDCIILMQRQWEDKNITVETELEPLQYTGDENLLKQVWLNLLSNAIKFTPPGGKISVTLRSEGGCAAIYVADTGIGIAQEDLPRVFDKYFQVNHGSGNGLGLPICKRIITLCGGQISAQSTPGKGSTFVVKL